MDPVSITALLVSLVSLLVCVGQTLLQYTGTGEGHRRCQPSVIGKWSDKTQWIFRWSELRYEVLL